MKTILGYNKSQTEQEIINTLNAIGNKSKIPAFRIKQIFEWIYKKGATSFDQMTNLPKDMRMVLDENLQIYSLTLNNEQTSKDKQAVKYVFKTHDSLFIETVRIIHPDRQTLCISTMAGCPLDCKFCATAKMGYIRSLETHEILTQILFLNNRDPVNNVVFMGMGEPLLNSQNVFKTITLLSDKNFLNFSARRFTISTAGIVKGIQALIDFNTKINLAVSLNSPFQKEREIIMPATKANTLADLFEVLKTYNEKAGRFTFEYIILPGINDSKKHADKIISFKKKLSFNLNIIAYNYFEGGIYNKCTQQNVNKFLSYFNNSPVEAVKRVSKGADIAAACGQLAGKTK